MIENRHALTERGRDTLAKADRARKEKERSEKKGKRTTTSLQG